jgi:hypothetical protein
MFVACQRWWFQWRFWFLPSVPGYLREEEEHKPDIWCNPIEINKKIHILLSPVYCVWQVVKNPTIISNNPVFQCLNITTTKSYGPGSSVGIANELRAGRSGIESWWGRDFPPFQTGPGAHPASCKMGTGSFPGVKCGRGVLLITHPPLVLRSWKSRAVPLPTLWATPGL